MITSNPVKHPTRHHILSQASLKQYMTVAIRQQQGYFQLLKRNGYIPKDIGYSDGALKAGLNKLLYKTTEGFNSQDLTDQHILDMKQALMDRIESGDYIEIDEVGLSALIEHALSETDKKKKVGLIREIMVIDRLGRLKDDVLKGNLGLYKVVDTSPKGGFADSLRYDIGVVFAQGLDNEDRDKTGFVTNQLNLEIKSRLDSFHITGFKGATLLSNEAYAQLKQIVSKTLKTYFVNKDVVRFAVKDTQQFRTVLAEYVVKWKLGKVFPIFYRIGEKGGNKQILLCTEFIQNITGNIGVSDKLQFTELNTSRTSEYNTMTLEERQGLTPQQRDEAIKKATQAVVMGVSQYDLWYGKI